MEKKAKTLVQAESQPTAVAADAAAAELTEQELLEEFGVLMAVEYGYQAL